MQATIFDLEGAALDTVELNDAIYGIEPNIAVVHQAVLRQQANARLGTHDTLTRGEVRGGGRKPWKQKGTGRARQGSTRSPQWRHGGVVFGPHPRSYNQDLPRKMRRLAMRSVLSGKAADGQILLIDSFDAVEPRTKAMVSLLETLRLADRKVLILTPEPVQNLELAAGNLPQVTMMRTHFLNLVQMLKAEILVLDRASLDVIESILGQTGGRNSRPMAATDDADASTRRMASPLDRESAPTEEATMSMATPLDTEAAVTVEPVSDAGESAPTEATSHSMAAPLADEEAVTVEPETAAADAGEEDESNA
ncbi:MAG: 50S ribosomal protein L4 [Chloroflexia bacterium]